MLDAAWKSSDLLRALDRRATGFAREQDRANALRDEHATARRRLVKALHGVGHDRPRSVRAFAEVSHVCFMFVGASLLISMMTSVCLASWMGSHSVYWSASTLITTTTAHEGGERRDSDHEGSSIRPNVENPQGLTRLYERDLVVGSLIHLATAAILRASDDI